MKVRRKFSKEFKQTAVRRLESGQSVAEVARALEVHPSDLQRWRRELRDHGERAFSGAGKKRAEENDAARTGASLRSRGTVLQRRLHRPVGRKWHPSEHEPQGKSMGQRGV